MIWIAILTFASLTSHSRHFLVQGCCGKASSTVKVVKEKAHKKVNSKWVGLFSCYIALRVSCSTREVQVFGLAPSRITKKNSDVPGHATLPVAGAIIETHQTTRAFMDVFMHQLLREKTSSSYNLFISFVSFSNFHKSQSMKYQSIPIEISQNVGGAPRESSGQGSHVTANIYEFRSFN